MGTDPLSTQYQRRAAFLRLVRDPEHAALPAPRPRSRVELEAERRTCYPGNSRPSEPLDRDRV